MFSISRQFFQILLLSATALAGCSAARRDVQILLHESNESLAHDPASSLFFFKERSNIANLRTTVYGGKLKERGFGEKLKLVKAFLEVANSNELIIIADASDVILNIPDNELSAKEAVDSFLENFHQLTKNHPNAVVMSAEEECCAAAMSHAQPGDYFDASTKERKQRACFSGKDGCLWEENDNIASWKEMMRSRALDETSINGDVEYSSVFLNSGILAGYPKDLLNLLQVSGIDSTEDDRAVLTDLMITFPEMIRLDYHQELFGNNPVRKGLKDGCLFERQGINKPLIHSEQMTQPFILHTPGMFYDCQDSLIEELGGVSQQRFLVDYGNGEEGIQRRLTVFEIQSSDGSESLVIDFSNYGSYGSYGNYGYGNYGVMQAVMDFLGNDIMGTSNFGNYGTLAPSSSSSSSSTSQGTDLGRSEMGPEEAMTMMPTSSTTSSNTFHTSSTGTSSSNSLRSSLEQKPQQRGFFGKMMGFLRSILPSN